MKLNRICLLIVLVIGTAAFADLSSDRAQVEKQSRLTIKAVNKLNAPRRNQTIELSGNDLAPLGEKDLTKIHVQDSTGKELLTQAVDTDYDDFHKPDIVIFQADFAPHQTQTFTVTAGSKQEYTKAEFSAYVRFG